MLRKHFKDLSMKWFEDCCYAYLDDIIVASRNPEEHRNHLRQVFHRLQQFGIAINIGKCVFGVTEVDFLGHHISAEGLAPSPQKVQAIQDCSLPITVKDLRRFLGRSIFTIDSCLMLHAIRFCCRKRLRVKRKAAKHQLTGQKI